MNVICSIEIYNGTQNTHISHPDIGNANDLCIFNERLIFSFFVILISHHVFLIKQYIDMEY